MGTARGLLERIKDGVSSRYTVERELGRGGMATVFLARDLAHDRPVAIKVLHPEIVSGFSTERFLREIRVLAGLQHPNILPLYDSGAVDGIPYFVMPFVAGESLRDRLKRDKTIPLALALRMTSEAAAALDYAHRQGVVHRDIKPENVLLSDDHVIVADFGIARAAARSTDQKLTATAMVIGTPAYMSPEQATADTQIDGRSDIYSLACVLFEAIAGHPPFTGDNAAALIGSRFVGPAPRIAKFCEGIQQSVDDALASALSRRPDDRPASAGEFATMLTASAPATTASKPDYRLRILVGSLTFVALAVALFFATDHHTGAGSSLATTPTVPTQVAVRSLGRLPNREARDLYLQGRASLQIPSVEGVSKAAALFQAAIDRDSLYAEAWAGLADVHSYNGTGNYAATVPRPEFEQARFAANRALALDSTLSEAHASLALVQMMYDYDWVGAANSLRKAETFDPGYENTYLYRSFLLSWLGKYDSANAVSREALHMNPRSSRIRQDVGRTFIQARRFADAERELRGDVAVDPKNGRLRMLFGEALILQGKTAEGVQQLEEAQRFAPAATRVTAFRVVGYAMAGRRRDAQRVVDSLTTVSDRSFVPAMDLAIALAGIGDRAGALTALESAYTDRTLRPFLRDPVFDTLKSDPRFRALITKLKLPP
jgi:Serine/threonine protein kinase